MDRDRLIVFVVGNSRSGTTMLAKIIGQHSEAFTLNELHFWEQEVLPSKAFDEVGQEEATRLLRRLLSVQREGYLHTANASLFGDEVRDLSASLRSTSPADIFAHFVAMEARRHDASIPVEQTPRNIYLAADLAKVFPAAIFINIVRDPRDVALSQRTRWRRRRLTTNAAGAGAYFRYWANYHPIIISLLWRSGVNAAGSVPADRLVQVRYEDILRQPRTEVARICERIGLDFREDMLEVPRVGSSLTKDSTEVRGIDPSSAGRWRLSLPSRDLYWVEKLTGSEMRRLGYSSTGRTPAYHAIPGLVILPFKLLLVLFVNRGRTTNIRDALARRLGNLLDRKGAP
jgi:hypothetical protein